MEEVGPDNEIGLDDVNGGDVVDVLDGGYIINDRRPYPICPHHQQEDYRRPRSGRKAERNSQFLPGNISILNLRHNIK